jgi:uncharacterized membrane protein
MFELLFKYPFAVFSKGQLVLMGGWPRWILLFLVVAAAIGLALLVRSRLPEAASHQRRWQATVIWLLESALVALLLLLLWKPAIVVAELKPQQNIIAVLVDDSRSMAISDAGATREAAAVQALQSRMLAALQEKFQTRLYRLDSGVSRISNLAELKPSAPATRIGDSLRQLIAETADLPIGAVVLLSDGSDNTGGINRETIAALRERRVPVHTVGFGREQMGRDVEIEDAEVEPHALADSRLAATVSFRQHGYTGRTAVLRVLDNGKTVSARQITFGSNEEIQTQTVLFDAGSSGAKAFRFSIDLLPGEENSSNNSLIRLVNVESGKRRILYIEGEPRWEYKFIRRAVEDDAIIHLASMVRTTENNIYRQGIEDPAELADGFPSGSDDLFRYQALVIGSVQASYFTPAQQELIRQFVDRRGGGLLLLGGRFALSDGGWAASDMADLFPVVLPKPKDTFRRDPATVRLTPAGADSIICRLVDDPDRNAERWKRLPYVMNYQNPGSPKPGAVVLATMTAGSHTMPFLVTENYGLGRTAVLATGGTWRWKMLQPLEDQSHATFWRQLLRWLITDTPGRVTASVASPILFDDGHVQLSAQVRDKDYLPASDARVEARISGPGGNSGVVELTPDATAPGLYHAEWTAGQAGSYQAEVVASIGDAEAGRDLISFERVDGMAEHFHTEQNRELLQKLSSETGGRYWRPRDLSGLASQISYSEAGITVRESKDLWNMPVVFLLILGLRSAEWLLRRKWGFV